MKAYGAILLNIDASGDPAVGRTVLQKLIYLQMQLGVDVDATYVPYYYGPFSQDVATDLADLVAFDYVNENRSKMALGYAYVLTNEGVAMAEEVKAENGEDAKIIKEVINKCRSCLTPGPLSYAAKVHYIQSRDPSFTTEEVAGTLGWKMTDREVRTGQELLEKLNLGRHGHI